MVLLGHGPRVALLGMKLIMPEQFSVGSPKLARMHKHCQWSMALIADEVVPDAKLPRRCVCGCCRKDAGTLVFEINLNNPSRGYSLRFC